MFLFFTSINLVATSISQAQGWSPVATMPMPLGYTASAQVGGKLYTFDGTNWSVYPGGTHAVLAYDANSDSWEERQMMPNSLDSELAASMNGKIYLLGQPPSPVDTPFYEYDPGNDSWIQKTSLPSPRQWPGMTALNGKIYAMGGVDPNGTMTNNLYAYDPALDKWTELAPMPTSRQSIQAVVSYGNIYAIGGYVPGGGLTAVEEYDPVTNSWTSKTSLPIGIWDSNSTAEYNGNIYVVGGCTGSPSCIMTDRVFEYTVSTDSWKEIESLPFARTGAAVGVINGTLYSFGGYDYSTFYDLGFAYPLAVCNPPGYLRVDNNSLQLWKGSIDQWPPSGDKTGGEFILNSSTEIWISFEITKSDTTSLEPQGNSDQKFVISNGILPPNSELRWFAEFCDPDTVTFTLNMDVKAVGLNFLQQLLPSIPAGSALTPKEIYSLYNDLLSINNIQYSIEHFFTALQYAASGQLGNASREIQQSRKYMLLLYSSPSQLVQMQGIFLAHSINLSIRQIATLLLGDISPFLLKASVEVMWLVYETKLAKQQWPPTISIIGVP
jgi:N-acetylneuraminic acid mutarotase